MNDRMYHHPRLTKAAASVLAGVVALLLVLPLLAWAQGLASLYSTRFEDPPFIAGLPLVGQDGWVAPPPLSPLAAVVSTDMPRQGKQSVQVWGGDLVHQDFIFDLTGGYYDAIGSYRRALNFNTDGIVPVRLSAHVRVDGPSTPGVNFFSAALSARAAVVDADGNVIGTIGIGQIDLSSDGNVYAHDGNEDVPVFQASTPITLGEWHTLALVVDFSSQTFEAWVDDEPLGTFDFPEGVNSDVFVRGSILTFTGPDTGTMTKGDYLAAYDNFSIDVVGGGRAK